MHLASAFADINWLAVIVATIAAFVLGGLWYSKALFGNTWMLEVGLTEEAAAQGNMPVTFGGSFVLQLLAATGLAVFLGPESTWLAGVQMGLWVGVLWVATAYGVTYLFEQRSLRLWMINAGYYVVLYSFMGAIIGAWH